MLFIFCTQRSDFDRFQWKSVKLDIKKELLTRISGNRSPFALKPTQQQSERLQVWWMLFLEDAALETE